MLCQGVAIATHLHLQREGGIQDSRMRAHDSLVELVLDLFANQSAVAVFAGRAKSTSGHRESVPMRNDVYVILADPWNPSIMSAIEVSTII